MFNVALGFCGKIAARVGFELVKHGPAIATVAGTIGLGVSAYKIGSAKTKLDEILEEKDKQIEKFEETAKDPKYMDRYTEEDVKNDTKVAYLKAGAKCAALYGPPVVLGLASVGLIAAGYLTLARRTAALAAVFAATEESYRMYRDGVIEKYGLDVDKELYYGFKAAEINKEIINENGDSTTTTESVNVVDENSPGFSQYAKFFDSSCRPWSKDPDRNLSFLITVQRTLTDRLRSRGHLFLNEVYEALDIPETQTGQVVGWIYDRDNPVGDNFVDLGIYKSNNLANRRFVNGYEPVILIDPNVDGNIMKYLWK